MGRNLRELEGGWRGKGEGEQGTWLDLERGGVLLIDRDTKDILELIPVRENRGQRGALCCKVRCVIDVFGSAELRDPPPGDRFLGQMLNI